MTHIVRVSPILAMLLVVGCDGGDRPSAPEGQAKPAAAQAPSAATPVSPVRACEQLTPEKIATVYPDKRFKIETDRSDPPNIYEALSACRYQEEGKEPYEQYYIDLEIRAQPNATEARKRLTDVKEMDYDKKGKTIAGYGDDAYFFNLSMADGGPQLSFVKDNVYYKLGIQTIQKGAAATLETELMALAKKVLE